MRFSLTGDDLRIVLTSGDLVRLGVDFERFDLSDEKDGAWFRDIFCAAAKETGFSTEEPISVHFCRHRDGACFYIRHRRGREKSNYLFSDFGALSAFAQRFCCPSDAELYRFGERFLFRSALVDVSILEYARKKEACFLAGAVSCDVSRVFQCGKKIEKDTSGFAESEAEL